MKIKSLSHFRDRFIDEIMLLLIEAMFETISIFLLINLSICFFRAVYNCLFKSNSRIDCVCCDANIIFFNITLMNKEKD